MRHLTTDPVCRWYSPPSGLFAQWRDRRSRGRSCEVCVSDRSIEKITEAKGDAWDEGFNAAERDIMWHDENRWENKCTPNPYRGVRA